MSYVKRLLGNASRDEELQSSLAEAIAIQAAPVILSPLERIGGTVSKASVMLSKRRDQLTDEIATRQEELRQVEIGIKAMDAASKVMEAG